MAIIFMDGFDKYGSQGNLTSGRWASGSLKVSDEGSYFGRGITLNVDRIPNGKWRVQINGTDMIFDKRPEFTIPQPPWTIPEAK